MEQVRRGERAAFVALFDRYRESAVSFAARMTGDADAAEELAHDAFMRVASKPKLSDTARGFRVWFMSVLREIVAEYVAEKDPAPNASIGRVAAAGAVAQGVEIIEVEAKVAYDAINRLDPRDREILYLKLFERLSYDDVAEICGDKPAAVKHRLSETVEALRRAVE